MTTDKVMETLAALRESLQADGADLQVKSMSDDDLVLEIVVSDETCMDCLLPESVIQRIIQKKLDDQGLAFNNFRLIYPTV
jgi:hypothetical protein